MVGVDLLAAHAVGHRQGAAGLEKAGKRPDQTLGIGEMREGIVDHDAVKLPVKACRLHITAEDRDTLLRKLSPCNLRHLRGNVDAGDRRYVSLQVVRNQHARSAGYIQDVLPSRDCGIIQNGVDDLITADHLRVPAGGQAVKECDDFFCLDHGLIRRRSPCRSAGSRRSWRVRPRSARPDPYRRRPA